METDGGRLGAAAPRGRTAVYAACSCAAASSAFSTAAW